MKDLPAFKRQSLERVTFFATQVFTHPNEPEVSYLQRMIEYDDKHFGAVFSLDYFTKVEVPTKSQWNSLKKKFKRHDKRIFVFKEHSLISCETDDAEKNCGQIEFGFFVN